MKRLAHVEQHLRARPRHSGMLGPELVPLLHLMLTPMTNVEIVAALGPGYTRRLVEYRWQMMREALCLSGGRQHLERMELLRIVVGLDPCFCERFYAELEKTA